MTAPFDFAAWLQATGWSHPEAGRRIGRDPKTVNRMANGKQAVSAETVERCIAATQQQIEALAPYAHTHEGRCQNCAPMGG